LADTHTENDTHTQTHTRTKMGESREGAKRYRLLSEEGRRLSEAVEREDP